MCDQVESIFQAIKYIEAHLQSEVAVAQVAEAVGYSLFHFIRTFNRIVHHTPYDYLTRRRLSEAARILTASDRRIADISQDFCFNNQESFSRAFKRMFDMQPSQWRDKRLDISMMLMPPKTLADLRFHNQDYFQYPVIEAFCEVALYGLMTALDADSQVQQSQRNRVISDLCDLPARSTPARFVAVTSYIDPNWKNAYFFAGLENKDFLSAVPTLVGQIIPAGRYVKIHAAEHESRLALNYLYFTWIPRTGFKPAMQMEVEFCSLVKTGSTQKTIYVPVDLA